MTILVTGSTGRIGAQVVAQLARSGRNVRALTRSPEKAPFPAGVAAVKGDLLDADAVRSALVGVKTLFLLVSNAPDELTQAINTLGLAREAGVQGIVYLSVTRSADYTDVSHFTAKHAVERMIEQMELPADFVGDAGKWLRENDEVEVMTADGEYLGVEPPMFVELEVVETDPGFKGDTVQGGNKPATLETGAVVQVPMFINTGEKLRIDTRDGRYITRV